jgi:small-conductance mechanosensitive channel
MEKTSGLEDFMGLLSQIWNLQLYTAGDTPVMLSQLIIAGLIILIGILLARRLAAVIGRRLNQLDHMTPNSVHVLQKLITYVSYVVVILVALPFAGIPITIFAVLGGAFAIGIGFGAQNLLNNLISGLILLIEKPIRIGDIVELENEQGRVEDVGNRCVRIRRFDGIHVLVPNSYFLEQRVVNWTLISNDIRGIVTVGVAYGSPTGQVRDLMLKAAGEQTKIHHQPAPEVFFEDFGDNSLNFSLYFWTDVSEPVTLRRLRSDLRYRIDELFAEAEITIAFPQRDVHLDTLSPLQVRLQRDD